MTLIFALIDFDRVSQFDMIVPFGFEEELGKDLLCPLKTHLWP